ncbi:hypothetical protein ACA910_004470 [Epithemia clementina (nom. ined.)]
MATRFVYPLPSSSSESRPSLFKICKASLLRSLSERNILVTSSTSDDSSHFLDLSPFRRSQNSSVGSFSISFIAGGDFSGRKPSDRKIGAFSEKEEEGDEVCMEGFEVDEDQLLRHDYDLKRV